MGYSTFILTLVAVIVLGVSALLNGAAFGQRLVSWVADDSQSGSRGMTET